MYMPIMNHVGNNQFIILNFIIDAGENVQSLS
jgi:hypothetical protein